MNTTLTLTPSPSSLVAVGSEASIIPSGTVIPTVKDGVNFTFSLPPLPDVLAAGGDRFKLTLLNPVVTATLSLATNNVTTAPFTIKIERFAGTSTTPDLSGNISVVLTTGSVSRPQCGSVGPLTTNGLPLQPSGELTLLANMCITSLGADPVFNQSFTMRLHGVIANASVPVPEPALGTLMLLCCATLLRFSRRHARHA
jgi:hypothetical protein